MCIPNRYWKPIVLVLAFLASGSGCQMMNAPCGGVASIDRFACGVGSQCEACYPPGGNPEFDEFTALEVARRGWVLPGFGARWGREESVEASPPFPRFHPLPTRPMFEPWTPAAGDGGIPSHGAGGPTPAFGRLPRFEQWHATPSPPNGTIPVPADPSTAPLQ